MFNSTSMERYSADPDVGIEDYHPDVSLIASILLAGMQVPDQDPSKGNSGGQGRSIAA